MRNEREKLNNGGYSLVELIVVILIMGIISLMLVVFITESQKFYRVVNAESELQTEADFAMHFMDDLIIEAYNVEYTTGVSIADGGTSKSVDVCTIILPVNTSGAAVTVSEVDQFTCYVVALEKDTDIMRFTKLTWGQKKTLEENYSSNENQIFTDILVNGVNASGKKIIGEKRALLARYVDTFTVTAPTEENHHLTTVSMELKYDGKEYTTTRNIAPRNGAR